MTLRVEFFFFFQYLSKRLAKCVEHLNLEISAFAEVF